MNPSYLIIGAGPCGLYLGHQLTKNNKSVQIVEKSRGVGGRVATRRIEGEIADHGAPYLKFSPQLVDLLFELEIPGIKVDGPGIFYEDGMTLLFKKMASALNVKKEIRIIKLEHKCDQWQAFGDNGETFTASHLILTAPLPQSLELLKNSDLKYDPELEKIKYSKALIGLFKTDDEITPGKQVSEHIHSVFSMKERNGSDRISILRLSEENSEALFENPDEIILQKIENLFIEAFPEAKTIYFRELKKWRYVQPHSSLPYPYAEVAPQLYLAGDAFNFPAISGALLSAEALVKKLI